MITGYSLRYRESLMQMRSERFVAYLGSSVVRTQRTSRDSLLDVGCPA